jgi:hypothetical protein
MQCTLVRRSLCTALGQAIRGAPGYCTVQYSKKTGRQLLFGGAGAAVMGPPLVSVTERYLHGNMHAGVIETL